MVSDAARLDRGYPGGTLGKARRSLPHELHGVDLHRGVAWAVAAHASSEWGTHGSWWAKQCIGRPSVWPECGDKSGAWAPSDPDSPAEWIEVRFDPAPPARAIRVFETHGAGCTYAVAVDDGDSLEVVWLEPAVNLGKTACMLEVVLPRARHVKRVRAWVDGTQQTSWPEIDTIALVLDERAPALDEPPAPTAGRGRRYTVRDMQKVDPAASSRGLFPIAARASSEFSAAWGAARLVGRPDVWPDHGDRRGAWAPKRPRSDAEWIEVDFPSSDVPTRAIRVFETNVPGSTVRVSVIDARGAASVVWEAPAEACKGGARVLEIELEQLTIVRRLRIDVDNSRGGWAEIDTVAILPVPTSDPYRGAPPGRGPMRGPASSLHERLMGGFDGARVGDGRRYGVFAMLARDWQVGWRGTWGVRATASSSWGGFWSADAATGKPGVYPLSGDLPGTWAPSARQAGIEWLEVDFAARVPARGVRVFETYHPGAVFALVVDGDTVVFADEPRAGRGADVLEVLFEAPRPVSTVRVYVDTSVAASWVEIDAIGLLRAE